MQRHIILGDRRILSLGIRQFHVLNWAGIRDKGSSSDLLNLLSIDKDIERNVNDRINTLESVHDAHVRNIQRLESKLGYIEKNIGFLMGKRDNKKLQIEELLRLPTWKVYEIVKVKCHGENVNEDEIIMLIAHMIFRNSFTVDMFSRVIMRLSYSNVKKVHEKLVNDPAGIIKGWNEGYRCRVLSGLALTARYKMLKDYDSARRIVISEFREVWIKGLIAKPNEFKGNDLKNFVNVVNGMVEYAYVVTNIVKVNDVRLVYTFWEENWNDMIINEWLEKNVDKLNEFQRFIIRAFNNPVISTNSEFKGILLDISKKLKLGIYSGDDINREKFQVYLELLINDIIEGINGDPERVGYVRDLRKEFEGFKSDEHEEELKEVFNV